MRVTHYYVSVSCLTCRRIIKFDSQGRVVEARYIDTYAYRSMDGVGVQDGAPVP